MPKVIVFKPEADTYSLACAVLGSARFCPSNCGLVGARSDVVVTLGVGVGHLHGRSDCGHCTDIDLRVVFTSVAGYSRPVSAKSAGYARKAVCARPGSHAGSAGYARTAGG